MDKYVVKASKSGPNPFISKSGRPSLKQATLTDLKTNMGDHPPTLRIGIKRDRRKPFDAHQENLTTKQCTSYGHWPIGREVSEKRVVVLDDIVRIKDQLEKNEDKTVLIECLNTLSEKIPSRKILVETKIGRTVKRLSTHEDAQVRRLSRCLCQKWNDFFKEQEKLVPVEVKSDLSTTKLRNTNRSFIAAAFAEETNPAELSQILESEIFHKCHKLVGKHYRRISRKLIFALKSEETRRKLKTNEISSIELIKEIIESMPKYQQP